MTVAATSAPVAVVPCRSVTFVLLTPVTGSLKVPVTVAVRATPVAPARGERVVRVGCTASAATGVAVTNGLVGWPVPRLFWARTRNWYGVPLVSPATVQEVAAPSPVRCVRADWTCPPWRTSTT